jgi:hypothetical protein
VRRAAAILSSPDDGAEVSDVAWPHFILPTRGYSVAARRLLAAAATGWPDAPADQDSVSSAARDALLAAVNSPHLAARPPAEVSR